MIVRESGFGCLVLGSRSFVGQWLTLLHFGSKGVAARQGLFKQELHKAPGRFAQLFAATLQDSDRAFEVDARERPGDESTGRNFAINRRLGQNADSRVDFDGALNRLNVVELHRHAGFKATSGKCSVDLVANLEVRVETDHVEAMQIGQTDALAFRQSICRRTNDNHRLFAPSRGFNSAARSRIAHQAQIDLIRLDELVHASGMLILNVNVGFGIVTQEPLNEAIHVRQPD